MSLIAFCKTAPPGRFCPNQFFPVMNITAILLLVACLQVSAKSFSQITLSEQNAPLEKVLKKIERKSGYHFFYKNEMLDKGSRVSISVTNASLNDVLTLVLKDQPLGYQIVENTVVITERDGAAQIRSPEPIVPIQVTGRVIDERGAPLAGVTISVVGRAGGTTSDDNGEFQLSAEPDAVLQFRYLGYETLRVPVQGRTSISVSLTPVVNVVDDVVVVAYGTQRKVTLTGAVSSVSAEQINTSVQSNMVNMLTGKLPGLRVIQRNSEPGTYQTSFDIRGMGAPLVIVDGVPRADFNRLNPNDIESISIIKDASAAVYGVKAANGVILVTTKRGAPGKTEFSYTANTGITEITNSPKNMSSYEWAVISNEAYYNNNYRSTEITDRSTPPHSAERLQQFADGTLPNTQWIDVGMNKAAPMQKHDLAVSGGTDRFRYYTAFGLLDEQGLFKSGDVNYRRYNFRSNISATVAKNLEAQILIGGLQDKREEGGRISDDIIKGLWQNRPDIPVFANNNPAYPSQVDDGYHPLAVSDADVAGYTHYRQKTLQTSLTLNYTVPFIDGLQAGAMFSYDYKNNFNKQWRPKYTLYNYDNANGNYNPVTHGSPSNLYQRYTEENVAQVQTSLRYNRTFAEAHNVQGMVLFEQIQYNTGANTMEGRRFFSITAVDQMYAGDADGQTVNAPVVSPYATQSLAGRFNYDFRGKYLLEGSFSYMGSSRFAPGNRWGFFPGAQAGWRISEEPFLKGNAQFLDNLKLRGSWGIVGDDGNTGFQWIDGYSYPGSRYISGGAVIAGLGFRAQPYEALTWFESDLIDLGLEADLWSGMLHLEFDWFRRKRTGLLAQRNLSLPATVGAALPQENLNSDLTRGLEVVVGHKHAVGNVRYNITANASIARTKNLYIERAPSGSTWHDWRGNTSYRWNDVLWGYKVIGQFQNQAEINDAPIHDDEGNRRVLPGDFRYEDYNNDGIIDDNDVQPIGRTNSSGFINTPNVNFGMNIDLQWKGFDFNALLQGATQLYVRYQEQLMAPLFFGRNGLSYFMDRWHREDPQDPNSAWIPGKYPSTRPHGQFANNYRISDFWVHDASYLRLRSVELGYTLPGSKLGNWGLNALRVYANAYNLFTWTEVDYIDPEHTPQNVGMQYPITRNFNFGVNITF
ncbi:MAG: SusC/RagA family TonB-linked outer membrane protein [Parapedobacter sp.]|nr:MAG: SusC/RagA family TonB-linked outer membrane protein [Parapedobacter sp.]